MPVFIPGGYALRFCPVGLRPAGCARRRGRATASSGQPP